MRTTASKSARVRGPVGPGAPQAVEELRLLPVLRRDLGDDLLGEDVERRRGNDEPVELAAPDAVEERRAFDQIVARKGKEPPLGRAVDRVARAADPLQKRRDRARRAELADEVDVADVDAELERGGGDHRFQLAALQPLLGRKPPLLGHAAVMGGDRILAEPVGELARDPLAHAAGVDEDERRPVLADEGGEPLVDLAPDFVGHDRFERRVGRLDREIARPLMARIDNRDLSRRIAAPVGADQQVRHLADRVLGGREPDALKTVAAEGGQAFERKREMRAALVRPRPHGSRRG